MYVLPNCPKTACNSHLLKKAAAGNILKHMRTQITRRHETPKNYVLSSHNLVDTTCSEPPDRMPSDRRIAAS